MSTPQTEAQGLAESCDDLTSIADVWSPDTCRAATAELLRLVAIEQRYNEMMANPCPEWDNKAYMQAIANLRAQLAKAVASNSELLKALELLLSYTLTCEAMLNAKPAGQIDIARAAIAKATGEHHE